MKSKLAALVTILLILQALPAMSKVRCTPVYIFGVSASFNDSIVYFTDIQILDSAWIDEKGDLLVNRPEYSAQLRDYLVGRGENNRTCFVSFALKEKDIQKKFQKLQKQFNGSKKNRKAFDVREIDDDEFQFDAVKPDPSLMADATIDEKASRRVEKSKQKKQQGTLKDNRPQQGASGSADAPPSMPPRH